jgi:hypothetical protein
MGGSRGLAEAVRRSSELEGKVEEIRRRSMAAGGSIFVPPSIQEGSERMSLVPAGPASSDASLQEQLDELAASVQMKPSLEDVEKLIVEKVPPPMLTALRMFARQAEHHITALEEDMKAVREWSKQIEEEMEKAFELLDSRPAPERNAMLGVRRCLSCHQLVRGQSQGNEVDLGAEKVKGKVTLAVQRALASPAALAAPGFGAGRVAVSVEVKERELAVMLDSPKSGSRPSSRPTSAKPRPRPLSAPRGR